MDDAHSSYTKAQRLYVSAKDKFQESQKLFKDAKDNFQYIKRGCLVPNELIINKNGIARVSENLRRVPFIIKKEELEPDQKNYQQAGRNYQQAEINSQQAKRNSEQAKRKYQQAERNCEEARKNCEEAEIKYQEAVQNNKLFQLGILIEKAETEIGIVIDEKTACQLLKNKFIQYEGGFLTYHYGHVFCLTKEAIEGMTTSNGDEIPKDTIKTALANDNVRSYGDNGIKKIAEELYEFKIGSMGDKRIYSADNNPFILSKEGTHSKRYTK